MTTHTGEQDVDTDDALTAARVLIGFGGMLGLIKLDVYGLVLECPHCEQPTTTFLGFRPLDDPHWDQRRVVLCNTDLALAVAQAATPEITHVVNAVGEPSFTTDVAPRLVNRCFHCNHALTGDALAAQIRQTALDALVELGPSYAPRRWVTAAAAGAGSFQDHGDLPCPAAVPELLIAGGRESCDHRSARKPGGVARRLPGVDR